MKRCLPALTILAFLSGAVAAQEARGPVRGLFCDSAEHAIGFANLRAEGGSEEIARDRIGRAARAEVCGYYRGIAVVVSEAVTLSGGVAYKVTAYRFVEDRRVAWLAETSFAPGPGAWSL